MKGHDNCAVYDVPPSRSPDDYSFQPLSPRRGSGGAQVASLLTMLVYFYTYSRREPLECYIVISSAIKHE